MSSLGTTIIASLLTGIILFIAGFILGSLLKKQKFSNEDYRALGEAYDIKMRSLIDENKALVKRWDSIGKLLSSFGAVTDKDKLAAFIAKTLKDEIEAPYSAVLIKEDGYFQLSASEGIDITAEVFLRFSADDPLIKYVDTFSDVVVVNSADRQFKPFKQMREKFGEVVLMPMRVGDETLGILWLAVKKDSKGFNKGQQSILKYLGTTLGYLVKNIDLISQLKDRALKIVTGLAKALEQKDEYTKGHSERVAAYSVMFSKHIGIDPESIDLIHRAALLHDIGKIGLPERILNKPDKLTAEEFEIVKLHPLYGAELLKILGFLKDELILILHHHEKFDGTGYPYGLRTTEIPKGAVIISLADVFDALTSDRSYRKGFSIEEAIMIMEGMRGTNFASDLLDHFLEFVKSSMKSQVAAVANSAALPEFQETSAEN